MLPSAERPWKEKKRATAEKTSQRVARRKLRTLRANSARHIHSQMDYDSEWFNKLIIY